MIFAIPAQGMSVKQVAELRKAVPADTKVRQTVGTGFIVFVARLVVLLLLLLCV